MNPFPFIGGSYAARSSAFDAQRTVNLYPETSGSGNSKSVAMLVGTPGTVLWATLPTFPIRGVLRVSGTQAFVAAGAALYSVTTTGVATLIGAIAAGTTPVSMASDGTYVMLVTGPYGYFVTIASLLLTPITDPAFAGSDTVDFLDGFFVFNTTGTAQFQISGLYATTLDALDFATAEALPDTLLTLIVDHDELWLFCSAHTEVWSNVGNPLFPFQRIQGAVIEQGCAAKNSVCKLDNTVVWLTADDRGHGTVQKAVGYTPQRISNHALEFAIASYSRIDDAVGYSYQQEGHLFYMLTFPTARATWCFDTATELWHERAYRDPVSGQLTQHRSICHMAFAGMNLVGDYQNGNLYSLDLDCYTDNGNILPAIRQCPHIAQGNVWQFFSKLWIDMQMGVGTNLPVITATNPSLLLHLDNSFADSSLNNLPITANAAISTVAPKFGIGSATFSSTNLLQAPAGGALDLSTGDFTIEWWLNPTTLTAFQVEQVFQTTDAVVGFPYPFLLLNILNGSPSTGHFALQSNGIGVADSANGSLVAGVWTHVAIVMQTNSLSLYVNGISAGGPIPVTRWALGTYTLAFGDGPWTGAHIPFLGGMDEIRVTPAALYTANFTPATAAFPNPTPAPLDPTNPQLMLDWSDDGGQSFGSVLTVSMGKLGERTARANFRRLGKSRGRVFRATITDPVKRIFIGAGVDFTVGA